MERSAPGGRHKADDVWEHVTVLEGKKKVKCKYCGFEFAESANRIKSHIHQIKGHGIRLCTVFPQLNNIASNKDKQDLLNPQGLLIVDRSRDYNKVNERMLDCYMSPKTMWEGIKALQQVQMHTEARQQKRVKVGPFFVSIMVNERDLQLIQYVFEDSCEMVFSSPRLHLKQFEFSTLRPQTHLDSLVIDVFAYILTDIERTNKREFLNWYLPVMFSTAVLSSGDDASSFLDFVQQNKMRDNYMSDLVYCEKIFIPVFVRGHYYLYIIHKKNQEVEIWDSLCNQFIDKVEREQITQKLLLAMGVLFRDVMFTKFTRRMAKNILLQPNGHDCGIFVINYMQQSNNYLRRNPLFQFDSDTERLNLALMLLKSDLNEGKEKLYDKASRSHTEVQSDMDLDLRGVKRKQADTYKTISEDVGRGASMKLDDSDNRVQRNNFGSKIGYKLPAADLVGKQVRRHIQQVWDWIMKNEASAIEIWGMGGVGKTALATYVHNKLLEEAGDDFDYVIWLTVSQYDNSIYKLQKAIAKSINLDISNECDVKRISGKLLHASKHINKCVLILDDVWDPVISLEEVGFPISNNGIKLMLTTRSWKVCQNMNCMENIIEVKPLDEEDGWDLFKRTLKIYQFQSSEVESVARAVANQCGGLPHAILWTTSSMKGEEHKKETWSHLLKCLLNLDNGHYHMKERIFSVLKSSYACLNNTKLQRFYLYYALIVGEQAYNNDVECLIRIFFYEGWADDEGKNLGLKYDEGHTMLDILSNKSLLIKENGQWKMHTLLRIMAVDIAKEIDEIMAKPGMRLTELPGNGEWKKNLQQVFLSRHSIQKILDGTSPKCSKLSTLLLNHNYFLTCIPDEFFSNMPALKILDLSWTGIKHLPESVSNLECLIALVLSECNKLTYVPSLEKLQQLLELDLSFTAINEAPCGLESLVNLKYLNLAGTKQLKISSSAISKMTNLQSLVLSWIPREVRAQDLLGLRKLEFISVNFCEIEEFNSYVKSFLDKDRVLKSYCLCSPGLSDHFNEDEELVEAYSLKKVILCGTDDLANRAAELPEDINELIIEDCDHWPSTSCLCHAFCQTNSNLLEIQRLRIHECHKLEYLCCADPLCLFCSSVQFVDKLALAELKDLKQIVMAPFAPSLNSPFLCLKDLSIFRCNRMNILITPELLAQFKNLEAITVGHCQSMVEIVGENCCSDNTLNPTITLPKLKSVALYYLPKLTFVFRGTMLCPSLKVFTTFNCEKLRRPHIEIAEGDKLRIRKKWPGEYKWKYQEEEEEGEEEEEEEDYLL